MIARKVLFLICFFTFIYSNSQDMESPNDYLSSDFHSERREELRNLMPQKSVAVVFSNPTRNRSNDVDYVYHQDPNMYYLSGYKEPHGVLFIFKDEQRVQGESFDELMFVLEKNELEERWDGNRLGVNGVKDKLRIKTVYKGSDFENFELDFSSFDKILFEKQENDIRDLRGKADLYDLVRTFKHKISLDIDQLNLPTTDKMYEKAQRRIDNKSLSIMMASLREIKTQEELSLLKKAVKISALGQLEIMKAMHPKMSEREVQGVHEFIYKKLGAEHEGYPSIVGAGHNGCILHYIENNKTKVGEGELVLMDLGAEYHGYTADVTRTIPANGTFTKEQKLIYDLVFEAQEAGIAAAKVGNKFSALNKATEQTINKGLVKLGIIPTVDTYHDYYPHGASHHIGLDVHDPSNFGKLKKNMVITVEPGIYIPKGSPCDEKWWGIAVRIEDDILITENGPENLSKLAPRRSDEIEKVMELESVLNKLVLPSIDE